MSRSSSRVEDAVGVFLFVLTVSARPLYVTVVYQGKYSHCMRIGVAAPLNSTVFRLRDAVSRETKIPTDQVLFLSRVSLGSPSELSSLLLEPQVLIKPPRLTRWA